MRNFNWETLPKHTVVGKRNIWTTEMANGDYKLDTDRMKELFSNKQLELGAVKRQSLRGLPAVASVGEMVSVNNIRLETSHCTEIWLKVVLVEIVLAWLRKADMPRQAVVSMQLW